jgi:hypothetical protein
MYRKKKRKVNGEFERKKLIDPKIFIFPHPHLN